MSVSHRLAFTCGALALVAGCATPPPAAAPTPAAPQAAKDDDNYVTGSRLRRTTHEQLIHKTGAAGAREMDRNRPPEAGPRIN